MDGLDLRPGDPQPRASLLSPESSLNDEARHEIPQKLHAFFHRASAEHFQPAKACGVAYGKVQILVMTYQDEPCANIFSPPRDWTGSCFQPQ
jgi:hypothetical protein